MNITIESNPDLLHAVYSLAKRDAKFAFSANKGSFSNNDGDDNENVKKQQLCTCIHFLVHFFAVTAQPGREILDVLWRT